MPPKEEFNSIVLKYTTQELLQIFKKQNSLQIIKQYCSQIKKMNENAQKAVNEALQFTLCAKDVSKVTPEMVYSSLIMYKSLLMTAQLNYYLVDQVFSQKIHEAVYKICQFQGQNEIQSKGILWLKHYLKLEKVSQNEQRISFTCVCLALQLLYKMAQLYPEDYIEHVPSMFFENYEKLRKKKVVFPQVSQFLLIKKGFENSFKKNLQNFLKQNQQNPQEYQNKEQNKINENKQKKVNKNLKQQKQGGGRKKIESTFIDRKNSNVQKRQQDQIQTKNKIQNKIIQDKKFKNQRQDIQKQNIQRSKEFQRQKIQKQKIQKQFLEIESIQLRIKTQQTQTLTIQKQKEQTKRRQEQNAKFSMSNSQSLPRIPNSSIKSIVRRTENPIRSKQKLQIQDLNSQKEIKQEYNQSTTIRLNLNSIEFQNKYRKFSMPKTQNKNNYSHKQKSKNSTFFNYGQQNILFDSNKTFSRQGTQIIHTLEDLRNYRRIVKDPNQIIRHNRNLLSLIIQLNLDHIKIPFVPSYFNPITLQMSPLRQSSLIMGNQSCSSQVFQKTNQLEFRLIKINHYQYILSILNISYQRIKIQLYKNYLKKYFNQIYFQNNQNMKQTYYVIENGKYLDFKFFFKTNDFNFKFLPFYLKINNKLFSFHLPITLLDQCTIYQRIDTNEIKSYALNGKIIYSSIRMFQNRIQPKFMLSNNTIQCQNNYNFLRKITKTDRNKKIIAQCNIKIYCSEQERNFNSCNIYLIKNQEKQSEIKINAIFNNRIQGNQNFSKVIVQLLAFLLKN